MIAFFQRPVVFVFWLLILLLGGHGFAHGQVLRLDKAHLSNLSGGVQQETLIDLPDSWNVYKPMRSGVFRYSMSINLKDNISQTYAIYLPRAGNRLLVEINGHIIGSKGELSDSKKDFVQTPHMFHIAKHILNVGINHITVTVAGEAARYAGLSEVWVGPLTEINPMFEQRMAWQVGGSLATISICMFLSLLFCGFGWASGSRTYVIFGLSALLWGFRTSYALTTEPVLPYKWWGWIIDMAYGGSVACLIVSTVNILRMKPVWTKKGVTIFMSLTALLTFLYSFGENYQARNLWLLLMLLYVFLTVILLFIKWKKNTTFQNNILLGAAVIALSFGIYDHIVVLYTRQGYQTFALARFSILFFMLAMSIIMARRFARSVQAARRSLLRTRNNLSKALSKLEIANAEKKSAQIKEAVILERQRIMRDMHDGFGSQLVGMLNHVRTETMHPAVMEQQVRELIDELRLIIDALEPMEGDLGNLLGALRYRLEHRFNVAGIELIWQVDELPAIQNMTPVKVQHIQRIFLEAFTNIIKHARASVVSVTTAVNAESICVSIQDNGNGFNTSALSTGRGLINMHKRASECGMQLQLESSSNGSVLNLILPISEAQREIRD
ncbi:ATP-binding protein [Undibacterium sp. Ji50W]|uniref:sensor histidine kinase n=1 Tax=Undibacterium sp. Ji50W TaxID=3413041 RepID=UPI003BF3E816